MALTTRFLTQTEALAALVARLKLTGTGEPGDPAVSAALDRVVDVLGASGPCANLDERERATLLGHAGTMLRQAMDLVDDPVRPGGWYHTDRQIIQGQGASSVMVAGLIAGAGIGAPGARILDVGTGVAALAMAFCRVFPSSTVVGVDPWELSLEIARGNVAAAGLDSRITLCPTRVEDLEDADGFDLVWLPLIFIPPATVQRAVRHAAGLLRPGGQIVLGRYTGSDDPLAAALGDLRTIRSGGTLLRAADTCALLEGAGLAGVREIDRTWPAPLGLTAARRP